MSCTKLGLGAAAALLASLPTAVLAHSKEDYASMGPLGFMWPPDRQWGEDHGMDAPCGPIAGPANRTDFPLTSGALSLEQKQEVFGVEISISFESRPSSNDDFVVISPYQNIASLEWSHVCLDVPSLPIGSQAGQNATIRLRYTAEYLDPDHHHKIRRHTPVNETFYACADVALVTWDAFALDIPCFNATGDYDSPQADHDHGQGHAEGGTDHGTGSSVSGGSGLSRETIAGVVIGSVVGVAVIATTAWYFWRRDRRERRIAQQMANVIEK